MKTKLLLSQVSSSNFKTYLSKNYRPRIRFTCSFINKDLFFYAILSLLSISNSSVYGQSTTSGSAYIWSSSVSWTPAGVPGANTTVTVNNPLTLDQNLIIGTGNFTFNQDVTDQPGNSSYNLTATTSGGVLDIKTGTTTIEGITSLTGSTLYVRNGATLILGVPGTTNSTNSLQIGNATTITIEAGGTLIVYGSILNSNSNGTLNVNGLLQVYGDYTSDNGQIILSGTGQFFTTGKMDSQGSSTIYGSKNNCLSNCSGTSLGCANGTNGTAYSAVITPSTQTICSGTNGSQLTFSTNAPSPTFQWESSSTIGGIYTSISGAQSANYTPLNVITTTWYRVKYTSSDNSCGSFQYSAPIPIYVSASTFTQSTAGQSICSVGSFGPISVSAYGTSLNYQWYSNTLASNSDGTLIATATSNIYTPSNTTTGATYYYCIINSTCGTPFTTNISGAFIVNSPNNVSTASSTPTLCINTSMTTITHTTIGATGIGAPNGLPAGVTTAWASNTITISGTPTAAGTFNYSIPLAGGCGSILNATGKITVNANNTVGAASSSPNLCINTSMTSVTHATTGATGIGSATGLPAGVTAAWASNTITISGTPTAAGTFNYSIPLTGGCGNILNATGTITVNANNTVGAASSSPNLCINTSMTSVTHATTGATGIGSATGLPAGVTAAWASNTITISGTPTAAGTFNYSVPLVGGCGSVLNATGTITVRANNTVGAASSSPNLCINSLMTSVTHATTGATGIGSATGLPSGVTVAWASNTITISGTPTAAGTFNYSIPLTGGCGSVLNATDTITVNNSPNNITNGFSATTICAGGNPQLTFDAEDTSFSTPYSLTYKNDITLAQYTIAIPSSSPYTFTPADNPTSNTGYTIISISNANCTTTTGLADSGANLIVRPIPTATITGTTNICTGATSPNITFTNPQTVDVTVTYNLNGGSNQTIDIATSSSNLAANTAIAGTFIYNLVSIAYKSTPNCSNTLSGTATITVNPNLPASVSIAATATTICSGTSTTFTATPTNGGTTPTYQWKVNGINVGTNSNTYTSTTLVNGDLVTVVMTSNATPCLTGSPATSNAISIIVNPLPTVSFTTQPGANACANTDVTYTTQLGMSNYLWGFSGVLNTDYTITSGGTNLVNTVTLKWLTPGSKTITINYTNTNGCTATAATLSTTTSINPLPTPVITGSSSVCSGITGSIYSVNNVSGHNYSWAIVGGSITTGVGTNSITVTWGSAGTGTIDITETITATSCSAMAVQKSITINNLPSAPTIGTITPPTCSNNSGNVVLNNLPLGNWKINPGNIIGSGNSVTIVSLIPATYNFTVTNDTGCTSAPSLDAVIIQITKTWNGSVSDDWFTPANWTPSGVPNSSNCIIIPSTTNKIFIKGYDINAKAKIAEANELNIQNGGILEIDEPNTLIVDNRVFVASGGSMKLFNGANLIQINDGAINSGNITVIRKSTPVVNSDYTYWSSPTTGSQTLYSFSPDSNPKYFLTYDNKWTTINAKTTFFEKSIGYAIISPKSTNATPTILTYQFLGTPNNGIIKTLVTLGSPGTDSTKLIGNPYPSALDADKFITANSSKIGTLYFWTHNYAINSLGTYDSNNYATYNLTGTAVPTGTGNKNAPNKWIASGQGFVVQVIASGEITFNNDMRANATGADNTNFYRSSTITDSKPELEKNRIWLDLSFNSVKLSQALIGYIESASNEFDSRFDGANIGSNKIALYSLIGDKEYTIQGRAIPFISNDIVSLGFKTNVAGDFNISLSQFDGLFNTNQDVYIEDKLLNIVHNLKTSSYTFSTVAGIFNNRFEIRYMDNKTFGLNNISKNSNMLNFITTNDKSLIIKSDNLSIQEIDLFSITGQLIYHKEHINELQTSILNLTDHQAYIAKVKLADGSTENQKIIF